MLTLLIGSAIVVVGVLVVFIRADDVTSPALAGETTTVGLGGPTTDAIPTVQRAGQSARVEWHLTTVSTLREAEDLLDSLEAQGITERELVILGNSCFAVRWR
jgi:hypothetical protein